MATKRQQELLNAIKKREMSVSRKIKRLESNGIRVNESEYDPRRPNAAIGNYSTRDMNSYLKKLDGFMDRKTRFVPGVRGKPIRAQLWREYKNWERKANQTSLRNQDRIKDVYIPKKGMTVGEYRAMKRGNLPSRMVPSVNDPFDVRSRISQGVPNEDKVKDLIKGEKRRATPDNFQRWLKSNRKAARKMLIALNEKDMWNRVRQLNDDQFHIMWEAGASEVALSYVVAQTRLEGEDPRWYASRSEDELEEVKGLVEWAGTVDVKPAPKPRARKPKEYTNTNAGPIDIVQDRSTWAGPIETVPGGDMSTWAGPIKTQKGIKTRRLSDGDEAIISVDGKKIPRNKRK